MVRPVKPDPEPAPKPVEKPVEKLIVKDASDLEHTDTTSYSFEHPVADWLPPSGDGSMFL